MDSLQYKLKFYHADYTLLVNHIADEQLETNGQIETITLTLPYEFKELEDAYHKKSILIKCKRYSNKCHFYRNMYVSSYKTYKHNGIFTGCKIVLQSLI